MAFDHFLVVSEWPDDSIYIEHPDSCPTYQLYSGVVGYDCHVGMHEEATGLSWWFVHEFSPEPDSVYADRIKVGRHRVEAWTEQIRANTPMGPAEWDGGLRVVDENAIVPPGTSSA